MENYFFKERSEKLCDILVPHIYTGFHDLFKKSKKLNYDMGQSKDKGLMTFQLCLKRIPEIPHYQLEKDYKSLAERLKKNGFPHDWLQKTLIDIFMSYSKSHLISLGASDKLKIRKMDLNIPENSDFIHKCYIECARCFWQEPYLFSDNYSSVEIQKNQVLAQQKIKECIYKTLRALIPIDQLVSIYHVGYSESIPDTNAEIAILPLKEDDRDDDINYDKSSMRKSKLQHLLKSDMKEDTNESDNYAKLNRHNLDKLQEELAKNTLVQRTKTLSNISTHHTKSVNELLKQATDKIHEVKKNIIVQKQNIESTDCKDSADSKEINEYSGGDEIEKHLDMKMSKNENTLESDIKSITIYKKNDYSNLSAQRDNLSSDRDTSMDQKLQRVQELLEPQNTEVDSTTNVNTVKENNNNNNDENSDTKTNNSKDSDESQTTIDIPLSDGALPGKIEKKEGTIRDDEEKTEKDATGDDEEKAEEDVVRDDEEKTEADIVRDDEKKAEEDAARYEGKKEDVGSTVITDSSANNDSDNDLNDLDHPDTMSTTITGTEEVEEIKEIKAVKDVKDVEKIKEELLEKQLSGESNNNNNKSILLDLLGTNDLFQLLEENKKNKKNTKDNQKSTDHNLKNKEDIILNPNKKIK